MNTVRIGALAAVLFFAGTGVTRAQVVDQENLPGASTAASSCGTLTASISQGFTPAMTPLVAVELYARSTTGEVATVRIHDGAVDGPVLGTATATTSDGWIHFDFGVPIDVVPGQLYVIEWVTPRYWVHNAADTYPGGIGYGCTNNENPSIDEVFRTYALGALPVEEVTWGMVKSFYR